MKKKKKIDAKRKGSFFLHPYVFLPAPHNVMQRQKYPYYFFKISKIHIRPTVLFLLPDNAIQ